MGFWAAVTPAIIGAAGSLLGGLTGQAAQDRQAEANVHMAAKNMAMQREFAQHGIRWKVEDAKKAGLHPLAALGSQTQSFSPVSIGDTGRNAGIDWSRMGQDISRAMLAQKTEQEREESAARVNKDQAIANYYNTEAERRRQPDTPPMPTTGGNVFNQQGQNNVKIRPDQVVAAKQMGLEAGTKPMQSHYVDKDGFVWNLLSQGASEPMESDPSSRARYVFHEGMKWVSGFNKNKKPNVPVPKNMKLIYIRALDQWRMVNKRQKSWMFRKRYYPDAVDTMLKKSH